MNWDDHIKREFTLRILWLVIAIIVAFLLIRPDLHRLFAIVEGVKAEAEDNYTEFYETSVAAWMAPMWREEKTIGIVTHYTNRPEETDDTPDITASGQTVRIGIVANNCLEFGDIVEIAGHRYTIHDRMNARYGCEYFDIFTFNLEEAIEFGSQKVEVVIIKLIQ